jgi:hypothetical protein
VQQQIACPAERQSANAVELHAYRPWISSGSNEEIIFKLRLISLVLKIHTRIYLRISHSRIRRHIRTPLVLMVSDEVVALARQRINAIDASGRSASGEAHAKDFRRLSLRIPWTKFTQTQDRLLRSQEQPVSWSASEEADPYIALSLIHFELHGQRRKVPGGWLAHQV